MNSINKVAKLTLGTRHSLAWASMGFFAPKLCKELEKFIVPDVPRPFTLLMKESFGDHPLVGCEVGFGVGVNTENILQVLNIKQLYSIEPLLGKPYVEKGVIVKDENAHDETYFERLNRLSKSGNVKIIEQTSDEAFAVSIPRDLDFVYIDGNHAADFCYRDISNAMDHVKIGGFVGGHDIVHKEFTGVANAVYTYSAKKGIDPIIRPPDFIFKRVS